MRGGSAGRLCESSVGESWRCTLEDHKIVGSKGLPHPSGQIYHRHHLRTGTACVLPLAALPSTRGEAQCGGWNRCVLNLGRRRTFAFGVGTTPPRTSASGPP
eukprot:scaffold54562_cov65-Phaeocystis_antarctica.AAC.2